MNVSTFRTSIKQCLDQAEAGQSVSIERGGRTFVLSVVGHTIITPLPKAPEPPSAIKQSVAKRTMPQSDLDKIRTSNIAPPPTAEQAAEAAKNLKPKFPPSAASML